MQVLQIFYPVHALYLHCLDSGFRRAQFRIFMKYVLLIFLLWFIFLCSKKTWAKLKSQHFFLTVLSESFVGLTRVLRLVSHSDWPCVVRWGLSSVLCTFHVISRAFWNSVDCVRVGLVLDSVPLTCYIRILLHQNYTGGDIPCCAHSSDASLLNVRRLICQLSAGLEVR